jgi:hypothetical protein
MEKILFNCLINIFQKYKLLRQILIHDFFFSGRDYQNVAELNKLAAETYMSRQAMGLQRTTSNPLPPPSPQSSTGSGELRHRRDSGNWSGDRNSASSSSSTSMENPYHFLVHGKRYGKHSFFKI